MMWLKRIFAFKSFFNTDSIYEYQRKSESEPCEHTKKKFNISTLQQCAKQPHDSDCSVLKCDGSCWSFKSDIIVQQREISREQMKAQRRFQAHRKKKRLSQETK